MIQTCKLLSTKQSKAACYRLYNLRNPPLISMPIGLRPSCCSRMRISMTEMISVSRRDRVPMDLTCFRRLQQRDSPVKRLWQLRTDARRTTRVRLRLSLPGRGRQDSVELGRQTLVSIMQLCRIRGSRSKPSKKKSRNKCFVSLVIQPPNPKQTSLLQISLTQDRCLPPSSRHQMTKPMVLSLHSQ